MDHTAVIAAYIPVPTPPYSHQLNTTMQAAATIILWSATLATLIWAVTIARRERSILPVMIIVSTGIGSLMEPIYDILYHLFWYTGGFNGNDITGRQWTLFTAFGLPQPVWVMPAYIMVFGFPALIMYRTLVAGTGIATIWRMFGILILTTTVFETTANNINLYGYYGSAAFRVLKYPLWIGVMESAQITGFTVICALLARRKTTDTQSLALLALFPANFAFDVIGAGFPCLVAMNMGANPHRGLIWIGAFAAMAISVTSMYWTAQTLLWDQRRNARLPDPATSAMPVPTPVGVL